jgi:hypothetical protein
MDTLRETNLIPQELKNTMDMLPDDSQLDLLATLLIKLEKEGKLNEIRKRVEKK